MDEICAICFWENETFSHNINGRCDSCGSTSFISVEDANIIEKVIHEGFEVGV